MTKLDYNGAKEIIDFLIDYELAYMQSHKYPPSHKHISERFVHQLEDLRDNWTVAPVEKGAGLSGAEVKHSLETMALADRIERLESHRDQHRNSLINQTSETSELKRRVERLSAKADKNYGLIMDNYDGSIHLDKTIDQVSQRVDGLVEKFGNLDSGVAWLHQRVNRLDREVPSDDDTG